jgi:hypothetical protein
MLSTDLAAGTMSPLSSSSGQDLSITSPAFFFATKLVFRGRSGSSTGALGDHPGCPALPYKVPIEGKCDFIRLGWQHHVHPLG